MSAHVPAVRKQCHRAEIRSGHDLADHHNDGQRDHKPGAPLVVLVALAEKDVVMGPLLERVRMHGSGSGTRFADRSHIARQKPNTITNSPASGPLLGPAPETST